MDTFLDSALVKLTALVVSYLALAAGIKKTADWIEDVASEERRLDAYELIVLFDARRRVTALSKTFARSLRWIFGDKQWSRTCFVRVALATLFVIAVGTLLLIVYRPEDMSKGLAMSNRTEWAVQAFYLPIHLIFNYLSVWKSRFLVSTARLLSFRLQTPILLFVELLLSFVMVVLSLNVSNLLLVLIDKLFVDHPDFYPRLTDPITFAGVTWRIMTLRGDIVVPLWYLSVPTMWASFVPAAVFCLFLLSRPLLRLGLIADKGTAFARAFFDIRKKPFKSIGAVAIVVLAFIYLAVLAPLAMLT